MSNQLLGAFSPYTCKIPNEAKDAFNEAMKNFVGVVYEPIAVSQQVVAGMNYHFFCNTESVTPYPVSGAAIVSIYKPLNEGAIITNIKPIN
jgi:hypothetical protein